MSDPVHGEDYEITYFAGKEEIGKGELKHKTHTHVAAVSKNHLVTVLGGDSLVWNNRTKKPFLPEVGDRIFENVLTIRFKGVHIHVFGNHIVVSEEEYKAGQIPAYDPQHPDLDRLPV